MRRTRHNSLMVVTMSLHTERHNSAKKLIEALLLECELESAKQVDEQALKSEMVGVALRWINWHDTSRAKARPTTHNKQLYARLNQDWDRHIDEVQQTEVSQISPMQHLMQARIDREKHVEAKKIKEKKSVCEPRALPSGALKCKALFGK